MDNIAGTFYKVSFEEYVRECREHDVERCSLTDEEILRDEYEKITLPRRATTGSAGYDFYAPSRFAVNDCSKLIPTGIRCKINPGWTLMLYPRSGLGMKFGFRLLNTTGIIDEDYYNAENEGHIMARVAADKLVILDPGSRFMQGVFVRYGVTEDDDANGVRTGGFGSTGGN